MTANDGLFGGGLFTLPVGCLAWGDEISQSRWRSERSQLATTLWPGCGIPFPGTKHGCTVLTIWVGQRILDMTRVSGWLSLPLAVHKSASIG